MSEEKDKDSGGAEWMQKLWRPAMGWMYMIICLLDMAIFPVCWSILQAVMHVPITQWNPLTLQGAGLFHIAMGAVLGISAFGRTQEKLAGTAANPTATSQTTTTNTNMSGVPSGAPSFGGSPSGFNSSPSGAPAFGAPQSGFGAAPGGFGSPAASTSFAPAPSWGTTPTATTSGFGSTVPAVNAKGQKVVPQDDFPPL